MDARWTHTRIRGAIAPTMRVALRVGTQGTGRELGAVQYWLYSKRSLDEATRICEDIEARAREDGYTILPDADPY